MHKELSAIAIFVAVAEEGGFSKAADKLGLSNSVISHHVSKLEGELGITLLYRSTRQVALSDQGRDFYEIASSALKSIEEAVININTNSDDPSGSLHIAMPSFMPDPHLQELIWDFASLFSNVEMTISYSDDRKELIPDGFDIAFRLGVNESSGMIARKLADIELVLVASPAMLNKAKRPTKPADIVNLSCISLNQMSWNITLSKGNIDKNVEATNERIRVDNIYAARDAAIAGLGMIPLPLGLCQQGIIDQRLERILPEWQIQPIPFHAVWNNKARRNSLTRRLITFIEDNR